LDFDKLKVHWHEQVFAIITHELKMTYEETEYTVRTTESGNTFEIVFWNGTDWLEADKDNKIELGIVKILESGDYSVGMGSAFGK